MTVDEYDDDDDLEGWPECGGCGMQFYGTVSGGDIMYNGDTDDPDTLFACSPDFLMDHCHPDSIRGWICSVCDLPNGYVTSGIDNLEHWLKLRKKD